MDPQLMKATLEVDDHHWWYRGRRRIIRAELDRLPLTPAARVLDAGCGSGRTLEELVDYGDPSGIGLGEEAAGLAGARGVPGRRVVGRPDELVQHRAARPGGGDPARPAPVRNPERLHHRPRPRPQMAQ